MSIAKRQQKRQDAEIIERLLRKGIVPTEQRVSEERTPASGLPAMHFTPVKTNELSDPDAYNALMKAIQEDLVVAYEETVAQGNELERATMLHETERKQKELLLKRVERRIERLAERVKNPFVRHVVTENFHSFNQISFKESEEQEEELRTDAHIDLEAGEVRLPVNPTLSRRYDLSRAEVRVSGSGGEAKELAPVQNALLDTVDGAWKYRIAKASASATSVTLDVALPEPVAASRLRITGRMPKVTRATLHLSADGKSYAAQKEKVVGEATEWQFEETLHAFRLVLTKEGPDFEQDGTPEYYFSLLNINLGKDVYQKEAHLVSRPFEVDTASLDRITLTARDVVYPHTAIDYYIGTDGGGFTQWQEVEPGLPLRLNQLEQESESLTSTTKGYGEHVTENFGVGFYSIGSTTEAPVTGTLHVYPGEYMWKRETRHVPDLDITYLPSLSDWRELREVEVDYVPIEETLQGQQTTLTPDTLQRFSVDVFAQKAEEIYNIELVKGGAMVQVYLNNEPLTPSAAGFYTYRLQAGWNHLEILTHAKAEEPFAPNLYFRDIALSVLASKESMKEVSLYHLTHNVSKRNNDLFAVKGGELVVNYDPQAKATEGVRYLVQYKYADADTEALTSIRVMAKLSNSAGGAGYTPVIKSYRIGLE